MSETNRTTEKQSAKSFVIRNTQFSAPDVPPGLYLVSTPIGNLTDITIRALEILAGVDLIACEDTRTTGVLLKRYGIARSKTAYTEHNAQAKGESLIDEIKQGKAVALVSDAGTPLVSDPGFRLVQSCIKEGIDVIPVPGASAPLSALVASGISNDRFLFVGFLPPKSGARKAALDALKSIQATLIFFESPKRLVASLADMAATLGSDRNAHVARELTKMHETHYHHTLGALAYDFADEGTPRGEIVIVVEGAQEKSANAEDADTILNDLLKTMSTKQAANEAARLTGLQKRELYMRALALKESAS